MEAPGQEQGLVSPQWGAQGHCCGGRRHWGLLLVPSAGQSRVPKANLRVPLVIPLASEMRSPTAVSDDRSFKVARLCPSCRGPWEGELPAPNLARPGGIPKRDVLEHSESVQRFWDVEEHQTHPPHPHRPLSSPATSLGAVCRPLPPTAPPRPRPLVISEPAPPSAPSLSASSPAPCVVPCSARCGPPSRHPRTQRPRVSLPAPPLSFWGSGRTPSISERDTCSSERAHRRWPVHVCKEMK